MVYDKRVQLVCKYQDVSFIGSIPDSKKLNVYVLSLQKKPVNPVATQISKSEKQKEQIPEKEKVVNVAGVRIFYGSQTGTAKVCIICST